jgi:PAS domain S-box-containing protein
MILYLQEGGYLPPSVAPHTPYYVWMVNALFQIMAGTIVSLAVWRINNFADRLGEELEHRISIEAELQKSEEKFRSLVQNSDDVITVHDHEGRITYASPSAERIFGMARDRIVGISPLDFVHPDDSGLVRMSILQLAANAGDLAPVVLRILKADGGEIVLESIARNHLSNPGIRGIVVNSREITERRHAEERLKASLREKELLLKEIHHRVKNNMQVISSLLSLQAGHVKDPADLHLFRESQARVRSMALVHEKLYRSRDLARIDFGDYLRDVTAELIRTYLKKGVTCVGMLLSIDLAIPCGLMVNELVANAFKHAFPGERTGRVEVTIRKTPDEEIELAVTDDGIGLPEGFDLDGVNSMGMTLVRALVAQLNGSLGISNAPGARFVVCFQREN